MKTVLVTGGTRGLGFELTKLLANNGYQVFMGCRNLHEGQKLIKEMTNAVASSNIVAIQLDVTNDKDIINLKKGLDERKIHIDILINNAALYLEKALERNTILEMDFKIIQKSMETNFYAPLKLCRLFARSMIESGYGQIINVSSMWGTYKLTKEMNDNGTSGIYRLSKNALNYMTLLMSDELKNKGVLVNAVCPGWIKTDMGGKDAGKSPKDAAEDILWIIETCKESGALYANKEIQNW